MILLYFVTSHRRHHLDLVMGPVMLCGAWGVEWQRMVSLYAILLFVYFLCM